MAFRIILLNLAPRKSCIHRRERRENIELQKYEKIGLVSRQIGQSPADAYLDREISKGEASFQHQYQPTLVRKASIIEERCSWRVPIIFRASLSNGSST